MSFLGIYTSDKTISRVKYRLTFPLANNLVWCRFRARPVVASVVICDPRHWWIQGGGPSLGIKSLRALSPQGSYPPPPPKTQSGLLAHLKWAVGVIFLGYFLQLGVLPKVRGVSRKVIYVFLRFQIPKCYFEQKNIIGVGWLQNENQLKTTFSAKQNVHFPSSQRNVKFAQLFAIFWEVGNKLVGLPPL